MHAIIFYIFVLKHFNETNESILYIYTKYLSKKYERNLKISFDNLQNGGACDHNPDSVQRITGSPIKTNPSLQKYWTVLPTR